LNTTALPPTWTSARGLRTQARTASATRGRAGSRIPPATTGPPSWQETRNRCRPRSPPRSRALWGRWPRCGVADAVNDDPAPGMPMDEQARVIVVGPGDGQTVANPAGGGLTYLRAAARRRPGV
jgi:hypothetical protein